MKIVYALGLVLVLLLTAVSCKAPKNLPAINHHSSIKSLKNNENSLVILTEQDILKAVKDAK
jgi:hypothetical protein